MIRQALMTSVVMLLSLPPKSQTACFSTDLAASGVHFCASGAFSARSGHGCLYRQCSSACLREWGVGRSRRRHAASGRAARLINSGACAKQCLLQLCILFILQVVVESLILPISEGFPNSCMWQTPAQASCLLALHWLAADRRF